MKLNINFYFLIASGDVFLLVRERKEGRKKKNQIPSIGYIRAVILSPPFPDPGWICCMQTHELSAFFNLPGLAFEMQLAMWEPLSTKLWIRSGYLLFNTNFTMKVLELQKL